MSLPRSEGVNVSVAALLLRGDTSSRRRQQDVLQNFSDGKRAPLQLSDLLISVCLS